MKTNSARSCADEASIYHVRGTGWRTWLRHCARSRKIASSIPDGVTGIFHWHNPSGRNVAPRSTQPLTEMSTRNFLGGRGGKSGRCLGLTTLPPSCADCLQIWEPQTPGGLRACPGLEWNCFTFTCTCTFTYQLSEYYVVICVAFVSTSP